MNYSVFIRKGFNEDTKLSCLNRTALTNYLQKDLCVFVTIEFTTGSFYRSIKKIYKDEIDFFNFRDR